jgi:hypothetical protein
MTKNSQSTTAMRLTARYAALLCARFTVLFQPISKAQDSIQPTPSKRHAALTSTYANEIDSSGTLTARAFKGSERAASRIARSVAYVIGIALFVPMSNASSGSIDAIQSIKELADTQLTEKQEYCHNQIVYRESRFINDASNGSHHGYYQGKSAVLDGAPDDYQFYWFYYYTMHRYGLDPMNEDMPNYCASLKHLKTKGWQ